MTVADVIERLEKRVEWLTRRIDVNVGKHLSYDEAERSALRYAIEHLRTCVDLRPHTIDGEPINGRKRDQVA
jgi:hypothetical protein